jgi:hypothetical protein
MLILSATVSDVDSMVALAMNAILQTSPITTKKVVAGLRITFDR